MKKLLACFVALSLLFTPVSTKAYHASGYQCAAQRLDVRPWKDGLFLARYHVTCSDPNGVRLYITRMGQFKRDLLIADGPTDKDYYVVMNSWDLENCGLAIEPLR